MRDYPMVDGLSSCYSSLLRVFSSHRHISKDDIVYQLQQHGDAVVDLFPPLRPWWDVMTDIVYGLQVAAQQPQLQQEQQSEQQQGLPILGHQVEASQVFGSSACLATSPDLEEMTAARSQSVKPTKARSATCKRCHTHFASSNQLHRHLKECKSSRR